MNVSVDNINHGFGEKTFKVGHIKFSSGSF